MPEKCLKTSKSEKLTGFVCVKGKPHYSPGDCGNKETSVFWEKLRLLTNGYGIILDVENSLSILLGYFAQHILYAFEIFFSLVGQTFPASAPQLHQRDKHVHGRSERRTSCNNLIHFS